MGLIYLKVLLIMAVMFAFMIPAFALKKLKMLGDGAMLTLSNILLYVCQPALAIKAFCVFSEQDFKAIAAVGRLKLLENFGICALISTICILAVFGLCKLVFIKSKNKKTTNVYSYVAIFSNCGFMGVPFTEMFTDGDPLAVMYVMVFNVVFILLCWTLGVYLLTDSFREIKLKKLVLNPSIIACVIAILLFFVPEINIFMIDGLEVLQMLPQYLAYMTAPLSMIIVGIRLAEMQPKTLFLDKGVYVAGGLRLIVAPFLTFGIAVVFALAFVPLNGGLGSDSYVYLAPVIAMAMSPAASVVAMAERFGGDRQAAASAFLTNTLLSIVTIPLVLMAVTALWELFAAVV